MRFLTMCKLVVDKIRKTYGTHEVLKEVSLTANAGDVVIIIDSSGSGKSTFLRCINFLEKPDSGIVLLDKEILGVRHDAKGNVKVTDSVLLQRFRTKLAMVF